VLFKNNINNSCLYNAMLLDTLIILHLRNQTEQISYSAWENTANLRMLMGVSSYDGKGLFEMDNTLLHDLEIITT